MAQETKHGEARGAFEQLDIGEKISALELANKVGATTSAERKNVGAFLSKQAKLGGAKKHIGEDRRIYYEKVPPTARPSPAPVAPSEARSRDTITLGEIGESIVDYIQKLRARIADLEAQREEFKRLYQEAEQRAMELSEKQPVEKQTIRLAQRMPLLFASKIRSLILQQL